MTHAPQYPSPSFRLLAVAALFVGLFAGGWVFFSFILPSLTDDGKTVYIKADKSPVKTTPEQPGGMEIPHQDKLVFNTVTGSGTPPATQERMAPPPEEPVYGNAPAAPVPAQSGDAAPAPEALVGAQPPAGQTDVPGAATAAVKEEPPLPVALGRSVVPGSGEASAGQAVRATEPVSSFSLEKADVPTATPRPAPAAPAPKPVKQAKEPVKQIQARVEPTPMAPKQQAAPIAAQGNIQEQELAAQTDVGGVTVSHQEASEAPQVAEPTMTTIKINAPAPVEEARVVAVKTEKRTEQPLLSVEPLPAPSNASAPEPTPVATNPAAAAPPVARVATPVEKSASPVVAAAGSRYQLASYTDRSSAEQAVSSLATRYGTVVSSPLRVVPATVKGHDVFRVQGVASSKTAAQAVCGRVKAQGGACVLVGR